MNIAGGSGELVDDVVKGEDNYTGPALLGSVYLYLDMNVWEKKAPHSERPNPNGEGGAGDE